MTLNWRRSVDADVQDVFQHLAPRFVDEYTTALRHIENKPVLSQDECVMIAKRRARAQIKNRRAETLLNDRGDRLAILSWEPGDDGVVHTTFAAKESFFALVPIRKFRSYVAEFQNRIGAQQLVADNWSQDPRIGKWFRLLGYEAAGTIGPAQRFLRRSDQDGLDRSLPTPAWQ